ncbi:hypothetical protein JXA88_13545 [Candidatus Fermentibacteria bacterium]|nr:hypothetical protein [Candidatus Fermentibacteria bacterium]
MMRDPRWQSSNLNAVLGCCCIEGITVGPSPQFLREQLEISASTMAAPEGWDAGIRDLLRAGGFRPAGRNRPAHEFLARSGAPLASISSVVDANNVISLRRRIPASVIDAAVCGEEIIIREGVSGERYVFNRSGQELDLEGLLVVCASSESPVASPVKDSLAAHVTEKTQAIVFCAYGSLRLMEPPAMEAVIDDFARLAIPAAGGQLSAAWVVTASGLACWRTEVCERPGEAGASCKDVWRARRSKTEE